MLSVLMSVYIKETPERFSSAMFSIWDEQTFKPSQIVLVEDGPLTTSLYQELDLWSKKLGNILVRVRLEKNVGLAKALNQGLKCCSYEYIARMDSDDICTPERFSRQVSFLENTSCIDVVGCNLVEIDENGEVIKDSVIYPSSHEELYKFFSKRDPIAHPTAMFRRSFFDKAGNYSSDLVLAEDTLLWYNGFISDCKFANIDYIGLKFRRTKDFYARRANWAKSVGLLKFRVFKINRNLGYGLIADIYAIVYFFISISPRFIKKVMYDWLR